MFASVIIDTAVRKLDRPYTYRVPDELEGKLHVGMKVTVPFGNGNSEKTGFVTGLSGTCDLKGIVPKDILRIEEKAVTVDEKLMELAIWMRFRYGGTLSQSLAVCRMTDSKVEARKPRYFVFTGTDDELEEHLYKERLKKHYARIRLLEAFRERKRLPASIVTDRLNISAPTLKPFLAGGLIRIEMPDKPLVAEEELKRYALKARPVLNDEQEAALKGIMTSGKTVSLLYGVTGSGKTEVYLRLIEEVLKEGRQAIVLIPEIALTYQTVMRFYERFGDVVSVVHSRLSKGEKYERFREAEEGRISVMIGPRSALFTPFKNTGLIVVDEFHETSYQSETVPKFDTAETAFKRAEIDKAKVVLGSATPTVEIYHRALSGEYGLYRLEKRAVSGSVLPKVEIADMRSELKNGNRSVFSKALREKIREKLDKNEQIMLFLNRRGYSGAVSCRSCGSPVLCPHCSVSLSYHKNDTLRCHICGYERPMVKSCPSCGSKLIGSFGLGTEKAEELVNEQFPDARTIRMDADTTSGKNGHRDILEKFMNHEADVLIGTQMIVKGHDFPNVTLVGILAADLSLNVPDYRSAERTFQLLVQAEGRAGRGGKQGDCIVQTYMPEHYAVKAAAEQDFESFYESEMIFRRQMRYPPAGYFFSVMFSGADPKICEAAARGTMLRSKERFPDAVFLGPSECGIFKVKDMYRYQFYVKTPDRDLLLKVKQEIEHVFSVIGENTKIYMSFEI